ncbi:unnamed protein product [Symbiodinium natans]|uniref:Uncharacterized protein n=1 Tax=Symbiodinium natans TaxID=878477 RepID=A0A812JBA7_9DINO|nr:unnamed protein product [Symbiodinium natans]
MALVSEKLSAEPKKAQLAFEAPKAEETASETPAAQLTKHDEPAAEAAAEAPQAEPAAAAPAANAVHEKIAAEATPIPECLGTQVLIEGLDRHPVFNGLAAPSWESCPPDAAASTSRR